MNQEHIIEPKKVQLGQERPAPAPQLSNVHEPSSVSLHCALSSFCSQSPAFVHSIDHWLPYGTSVTQNTYEPTKLPIQMPKVGDLTDPVYVTCTHLKSSAWLVEVGEEGN